MTAAERFSIIILQFFFFKALKCNDLLAYNVVAMCELLWLHLYAQQHLVYRCEYMDFAN